MSPELPPIPLANLARQHALLHPHIDRAIQRVLERADFVRGQALGRFEAAFARAMGASRCVGVASGTDALVLALEAGGVGAGHEVITAANTFAATAEAAVLVGATPVLVDVRDDTLNLDPEAVEAALTPATRAIIPVHLHGHPADMPPLLALARARGVLVIEDAAQAHGATLPDGRRVGTLGDMACFSFFPSKNLGACGDGGAVLTSSEALATRVRMLRDHGRDAHKGHQIVGRCSRLDTLQAAILEVKLPHLPAWNEARRALARRYAEHLGGVDGLRLPPCPRGAVFHHYTVRTPRRDALKAALARQGIAAGLHYQRSLPREPAFAPYRRAETPVADRSCDEVLSLPLFPEMTWQEQDRVLAAVRGFFG